MPQSKRGKGAHKSRPLVPYGGFLEASRGGSNGDRGVSVAFHGRGGPPRSVRHTETLVSARVCTGAQLLLDGYGKGQGGLPDPLSEGGAIPPWPAPGYTRQPGQGKRQDPIRGGGGGSGTTPTPTQGGRTYPPPRGALQEVATEGVPRETVKDPPTEGAMDVPDRPSPVHVSHEGDTPVVGMGCPGPDSK